MRVNKSEAPPAPQEVKDKPKGKGKRGKVVIPPLPPLSGKSYLKPREAEGLITATDAANSQGYAVGRTIQQQAALSTQELARIKQQAASFEDWTPKGTDGVVALADLKKHIVTLEQQASNQMYLTGQYLAGLEALLESYKTVAKVPLSAELKTKYGEFTAEIKRFQRTRNLCLTALAVLRAKHLRDTGGALPATDEDAA